MVMKSAIIWLSFLSFTLKRDHHRDKEQLNQPGSKIRLWEAKNNPFKKNLGNSGETKRGSTYHTQSPAKLLTNIYGSRKSKRSWNQTVPRRLWFTDLGNDSCYNFDRNTIKYKYKYQDTNLLQREQLFYFFHPADNLVVCSSPAYLVLICWSVYQLIWFRSFISFLFFQLVRFINKEGLNKDSW